MLKVPFYLSSLNTNVPTFSMKLSPSFLLALWPCPYPTGPVKHFLFGAPRLAHASVSALRWFKMLSPSPFSVLLWVFNFAIALKQKEPKNLTKSVSALTSQGPNGTSTIADPCLPLFWWRYQAVSGQPVCAWCPREQHPIPKPVV